jgi:hypothetical protein
MQSSVKDRPYAFKGGAPAQGHIEAESLANGTRQRDKITITAADTLTTLTVDGTAYTVNSAGGTLSKNATASALVYALEAADENVIVIEIDDDDIYLESKDGSAVTLTGTANCSVTNEIAATAGGMTIPYGCVCVIDAKNPNRAKLPTATGEITDKEVVGIAVGDQNLENPDNDTAAGYKFGETMSVCYRGVVWAKKDAVALTRDDDVYVRHVAGTGEQLGSIRNDADTTDATELDTGIRIIRDAAATDSYVLVAINLP